MATPNKLSEAARLLARRSVQVRRQKWGEAEFRRRLRAWGKLGGRPPRHRKEPRDERAEP
jgi:hypothetical protein